MQSGKAVKRAVIVSGSERTFTFRVSLNTLPTQATLVCYIMVNLI